MARPATAAVRLLTGEREPVRAAIRSTAQPLVPHSGLGGNGLGVHLQPIMHRLIVPDHLPEIPHIDRLSTERAGVKMLPLVLGWWPWWRVPVIGGPRSDSLVISPKHPFLLKCSGTESALRI